MSSKPANSAPATTRRAGRKSANPVLRSAAWRISLWATLAFALGTLLVFTMLHRFVSNEIQQRSDAWLSGEVEVLGDVAEHTPKDRLYSRVVGEVAELASREIPDHQPDADDQPGAENDSVFFLQAADHGPILLWVGSGDGAADLRAIRRSSIPVDVPFDLNVQGFAFPFRVAAVRVEDGSHIYLGLSERDELRVLRNLQVRFLTLWLAIVLLGFVIVFYATRRMLGKVREITEAASRIGQSDLSTRVPNVGGHDEVGHLARTLNHMLDRIQSTVHQLHTMTDALAHDLRSPLTAIRGKLETTLSGEIPLALAEPIVSAIDDLDRLTELLTASLDVAEANADALRLNRSAVDLDPLLRGMIDLYEPSLHERGIQLQLRSAGPSWVLADAALLQRVVANLLGNELNHVPASCTVWVCVQAVDDTVLLSVEDDGPGFAAELIEHVFERSVKGRSSQGHGMGLAFVEAVVRVHGGSVTAANRPSGGARITITLPALQGVPTAATPSLVLAAG